MNLFTRMKIIGPIGLWMVSAGTAMAAAPASTTCANADESAQTPGSNPSSQDEAAPQGAEQQSGLGIVDLVGEALSQVCLNDQQRTAVDQLGKQVSGKQQQVEDARHAFFMALADQLRSGNIDENALKSQIDGLVKAQNDASPVLRKAFDDLHGTLDKGQRATFADAIKAHAKEHADDASGTWFDTFAKDLNLSGDQKTRAQAAFEKAKPDLQDESAKASAVFDAFKGDDFAMDKVAPAADVGKRAQGNAEKMIALAKDLTGILTPEQRANLASKIENKAASKNAGNGASDQGASSPNQGNEPEAVGTSGQNLVVVGGYPGYRAGGFGRWGWGGYGIHRGFRHGFRYGYGYRTGYPFIGGYRPGIW